MRKDQLAYNIAEDQRGYFTTAQALEGGLARADLTKLIYAGYVEHISWGLYRLTNFPRSALDQYMEATLWPWGSRGVLSHETALEMHGMSDANPEKIHLTLDEKHRVRRAIPAQYVIHYAPRLRASDIAVVEGIPVTTPARTIRDCMAAQLGPAIVRQAIDDGRRTGKLSQADARALEAEMSGLSVPFIRG